MKVFRGKRVSRGPTAASACGPLAFQHLEKGVTTWHAETPEAGAKGLRRA